jgi:hypothetical protein
MLNKGLRVPVAFVIRSAICAEMEQFCLGLRPHCDIPATGCADNRIWRRLALEEAHSFS